MTTCGVLIRGRQARWGTVLPAMRLHALLLIVVGCQSLAAETLSVRADEWYPMNGDPRAEKPGFAIEILREILQDSTDQLDYQVLSWRRSLNLVRRGEIDCVVGAYHSDAPDLVFPQIPLSVDILAFYVPQGSPWRFQGTSSLRDITVGVIGGYSYGAELDTYIQQNRDFLSLHEMQGNDALTKNIAMLMSGRVDTVIDSVVVMRHKLREMELEGLVVEAGRIAQSNGAYMACSPLRSRVPAMLQRLDGGMRKLHESGRLAEIMRDYDALDNMPAPHWFLDPREGAGVTAENAGAGFLQDQNQ